MSPKRKCRGGLEQFLYGLSHINLRPCVTFSLRCGCANKYLLTNEIYAGKVENNTSSITRNTPNTYWPVDWKKNCPGGASSAIFVRLSGNTTLNSDLVSESVATLDTRINILRTNEIYGFMVSASHSKFTIIPKLPQPWNIGPRRTLPVLRVSVSEEMRPGEALC